MKSRVIGFTKSLGIAVFVSSISSAVNAGDLKAEADIRLCLGNKVTIGEAKLKEKESAEGIKQVEIEMKVEGLTPGKHAVHIHQTGDCNPCSNAGGHFDPGPNSNTDPDGNHPFHMGDLINIEAKSNGKGKMKTITSRVTLSDGLLSLFDGDGSAFIIHDNKDTYCPGNSLVPGDGKNPVSGCAGGSRFACGIIKRKS